jgi:glycosyltransferase involved in cell wall biosynthesis
MIKVCYVVPGLGGGGAEKQLCELAGNLDRNRFDPIVLNLHESTNSQWSGPTAVPTIGLPYRGKRDLAKVVQISRVLAAEKPDVLHCFLTSGNFYGLLASLATGVSVRIAGERSIGTRLRGLRRAAYSRILPIADAIVTNSQRNRQWLEAAYPAARSKISVIHNGCRPAPVLDPETLAQKRRGLGIRAEQIVIASVTHMTPEKDVECLVRGAGRLKRHGVDFKVLIAGDGPRRAAVNELIAADHLADRIHLVGHVPHAEALCISQLADIFVLTSRYEGMPNALMEAMIGGRACVATTVGGVPELIDGTTTGLLFDPGDDEALASRLLQLAADPALRLRVGDAARARLARDFSVPRMVQQHQDLYASLLERRRMQRKAS